MIKPCATPKKETPPPKLSRRAGGCNILSTTIHSYSFEYPLTHKPKKKKKKKEEKKKKLDVYSPQPSKITRKSYDNVTSPNLPSKRLLPTLIKKIKIKKTPISTTPTTPLEKFCMKYYETENNNDNDNDNMTSEKRLKEKHLGPSLILPASSCCLKQRMQPASQPPLSQITRLFAFGT